jgi:hypothetical protein
MSSVTESYDRSLALRVPVETLTQQFEELKQLRERIRRVKAKAIYASRYRLSRWRKQTARSSSLGRYGRRVR